LVNAAGNRCAPRQAVDQNRSSSLGPFSSVEYRMPAGRRARAATRLYFAQSRNLKYREWRLGTTIHLRSITGRTMSPWADRALPKARRSAALP
jgi:hypothetical protein